MSGDSMPLLAARSRSAERRARRTAAPRPVAVPADAAPDTALPERWAVEPAPTEHPCPTLVLFLAATLLRTYERSADRRWGELLRMVDAAPDGSTMTPKQRAAYKRELARRGDLMVEATRRWWAQYGAYWLEAPEAEPVEPSDVPSDEPQAAGGDSEDGDQ